MNSALTFSDESFGKRVDMDAKVSAWHVVPAGEPHELDGVECACKPELNIMPCGGKIVIHSPLKWN